MNFMNGLTDRIKRAFGAGNDELLFFILIFILIFSGSLLGAFTDDIEGNESGTILFFVVMFLFLLLGSDREEA